MSQRRRQQASYFTHAGNPLEMARLKRQGAVISDAAGGTLPGFSDVSHIHDVLDLACGTGEWALRLVHEYPDMHVTGTDISDLMVNFAQAQAQSRHLPATFRVMDILKMPLSFPDASFDLINIRLIFSFMKRETWLPLLLECARMLRTGGHVRITETEMVLSNDARVRLYTRWWMEAFHAAGYTFAVKEDGKTPDLSCPYYGIPLGMPSVLRQSNYIAICRRPFDVDFSYGTKAYEAMMDDLALSLQTGANFLMKYAPSLQQSKEKEIEEARAYVQGELAAGKPDFQGYWHLVTTIGQKPAE
jgi:SAM-dependent methyltransferase